MPLLAFLIPETTIHENGVSSVLELTAGAGPLLLTLGILEAIEQQSLLLGIDGSTDGIQWSALIDFPQKFYTGIWSVYLDLVVHPTRFLRAHWKVDRWGRGTKIPAFRIYLVAEATAG